MQEFLRFIRIVGGVAAAIISVRTAIFPLPAQANPLTIDDVLRTVSIEEATPSPDGRDLAVVVQRPAGDGEVAGRTYYEVDPSRDDIWLVRRDGSNERNLTSGHALAAGYWCAQWSPDGEHIAMLSTRPEGSEPHGGNAVRLYLWSRARGTLKRLSDQPMMTMTRYGSPQNALDLRGGAATDQEPHACKRFGENAPFLWLDEQRLLVVQMPAGQNSALFTQYGRALESAGETAQQLRVGQASTVDVSDSDRGHLASAIAAYQAEIAVINTTNGERQLLTRVPAFPFRGMLSLVVSPDRKTVAVLAPSGVIPPHEVGAAPFNNDETQSDKRLALIDIEGKRPARWIAMPKEARYPLDLLNWSTDNAALLLRAREAGSARAARVFRLHVASERITPVASGIIQSPVDAGPWPHSLSVQWQRDSTLLVRGRHVAEPQARETWWQVIEGQEPVPAHTPPEPSSPDLPAGAQLLAQDEHGRVWQQLTENGLAMREEPAGGGSIRDLLLVNQHLAAIEWGEVSTIEYTGEDGHPLKALVIMPPGHREGQRHPTLVWVYPGTMIRGLGGYWDDPLLPGIYNLQLYAANGYVVLVPSMPLNRRQSDGFYTRMKDRVLPAVDSLVGLGVADPGRIGLFGQSFGGYATYALVTQTDRFAAAAAIDGITDITAMYGAFDRGADGWPGIAQDKSVNPVIAETAMHMPGPAYADPEAYAADSPVNHTAAIHTPLLMAHGSLDTRGGIGEAETIFTLLDQQGKPARLLRYQGENHAIALSPANVRDLYDELIHWFDHYLKDKPYFDR